MDKCKIINHTFKCRDGDYDSMTGAYTFKDGVWQDVTTDDLFKNKTILLFSLPGAFTPTCSSQQLPTYDKMWPDFKMKGVDDVYCISVNDAFVMNAWERQLGIRNVKMIPDGCGTFTRSMGMLVDKPKQGFGMRSWRYAALIENGVVEQWFEEPGINNLSNDEDPYGVTSPENVLAKLEIEDEDELED